ncbi:MAG TPA: lasso peptide biosynthesis B2 protein [Nitrospira sp.]|nr:lasso peptide biosynthesis B2 protein [Nitrospira sp.]
MRRPLSTYWVILRVGLLLVWVRILLRFMSLPQVLGMLEPKPSPHQRDERSVEVLLYYVDRWLLLFPYNSKGNCFPRSVALYRYARRLGFPVRLHCGVRKDGGTLNGHAWLTLDGNPFHEMSRQWQQFTVTFSYPFDHSLTAGRPLHG